MQSKTRISEEFIFVKARDRFIVTTGSLPPIDCYDSHPALDAVARAIRYASLKRYKHENMDQELRLLFSEVDAKQTLYTITQLEGKYLHLGGSLALVKERLSEIFAFQRKCVDAEVDAERKSYGRCKTDMSGELYVSSEIPILQVVAMLIDPEPPRKGNHQHVNMRAWLKLREVPPPEHAWLTQPVAWRAYK